MKITRRQLIELIKETVDIAPGLEDDPVSLAIVKARASANKNTAFPILHDITYNLSSGDSGMLEASKGLLDSKRNRAYESYDIQTIAQKDQYFKETIEELNRKNTQNISASTLIIPTFDEYEDEEIQKLTTSSAAEKMLSVKDYFKGVNSNNEFISTYVKNLKGVNPEVAVQSILDVMSCTDFNFEEDNDRWEIAALIICSLFLRGTFNHTDATSRGVDVEGGKYKIEVKASQKPTPQDNYSNTIPPMDENKYYVFIATDRCYLIRSDILRRYYLEPVTDEQAEHFSGVADKQYVSDFLMRPEKLFDKLNLSDVEKDFETFNSQAITKSPEIADLHAKIKGDIIDSADSLAASIIQTIAGVPDSGRINAPKFGFGGLKIAMRLISRPEKSAGALKAKSIVSDIFRKDPGLSLVDKFQIIVSTSNKALFPNTKINVTKDDRKELTNMAVELLNQINQDSNLAQELFNRIVQSSHFEKEIMNLETPTKVTNLIKALFLKVLKDSGMSSSTAKSELKNKLPEFYKTEMQEPKDKGFGFLSKSNSQSLSPLPEPDFRYKPKAGDLREDRKIQERRRIYELGESHASLLRKKYYGRR